MSEKEADEADAKRRVEYLTRQNEARAHGMDGVLSVRLKVPKSMEHVLAPGENGESIVLVFYNTKADMVRVMAMIAETHEPMEILWALPIGKIPLLLPPPN